MMFVIIPVARRAEFCQKSINDSPYQYAHNIKICTGYPIDVELPQRVDFILFEPPPASRERKQLSREDSYLLDLIKKKHLVRAHDSWQRVLFI